ncbi:MAG: TonB-dependent receptor [Prevotella sp.]|nr:TonB-dependent receptor [Prevotella sp.]
MRKDLLKCSSQRVAALVMASAGLMIAPQCMTAGLLRAAGTESIAAQAGQQRRVSGTVVDANGEPVIGATVREVGNAKNGVITDIDGNFSINVPSGAKLEVSYVGYQTSIVAANAARNVTLKEDAALVDEVVVVGYGVQKKSDVTGSVTSIRKERLEKLPVSNVLQAVQGTAAGVTIQQSSAIPGDAPSALVRGQNSINANSGPYIVVDGVPISKAGGSLNDINPGDIESMEILKDASATAIYGMNGANGVILITTKHGSDGKPKISYNGYLGIEDFTNKLNFCNGEQITQRYKDYVAQNAGETMINEFVKNQYEVENQAAGKETDWIDEATQTGIIQNHNVSINGGAEHVKYFISGDYMNQKGLLKGYNYKRYSMRTNIDMDVTDYMRVGTNTYVVSHNKDGGRVNFVMAESMSPYAKEFNDDGTYCIYPMYSETLFTNPMLGTTQKHERRQWNINLNGYAEISFGKIWKPLRGLKYKFNFGYAYVTNRNSYYNGRLQNNNTGYGEIFNGDTQTYTAENILSYARDFGKHHIDLTGLYAASRKKYNDNTAKASKFINDNLLWYNLGSGETPEVASYADLYTTCSQMGRVNYSYDSRYLFTFTVRRDGSSVFSKGNKWGTFPSVALGWNITNESFMEKATEWMNNLKLRLSYGKAGNEAIGVYQTLSKMNTAMLAMNGAANAALIPSDAMGNSGLSWETTKTFNVGLDFGFLNNRINGTLDVYFSKTTDLLLRRNLPKVSGFNSVYSNMGETKNTGVELTINSKNIVTKDFTWSSNLVWSWNKNEIIDLYGDKQSDLGNRWFIGNPIGVIYDYKKVGIWQEDEIARGDHLQVDPIAKPGDVKLADLDGDHQITDGDRRVIGQTTPKWIGGLTNTFTYKDFTLSFFIQTTQGIMRNNALIAMAGDEMGRRNTTTEIGYWTPENKSNEWRSLRKDSNPHGYGFPQKAAYTRLKDVTLSYTFPKNITDMLHIGGLQLYVSGRNLVTWTDWTGWDPESSEIQRGWGGYENSYPMTKSYVFGVNLTF